MVTLPGLSPGQRGRQGAEQRRSLLLKAVPTPQGKSYPLPSLRFDRLTGSLAYRPKS